MLAFIEKLSGKRSFVILLVLYAIVFGAIILTINQLQQVTGGYGILDFETGYDKALVMEVFGSYGTAGFALNARVQLLDLINPALYSLVLAALTFRLWKSRRLERLAFVPLLAGLFDYLENITLFLMTQAYPNISDDLVSLSSTLGVIKSSMFPVALLPLIIGLILWLWGLLRPKSS